MEEYDKLYKIIKAKEQIRYDLEVELYNKYKEGLHPNKSFIQKTFQWPNPKYETNKQKSIDNTVKDMKQYILDVDELIERIKIKIL
jgi:hypothetical protein